MLRVGAATEVELKEKKHRLEDAISATRAAIEEGIVSGGGSALVHVAKDLDDLGLHGRRGHRCRHRAPRAGRAGPLDRRERRPRGLRRHAKIAELPAGHGLNAATGEYGDLVAQGVIDPVKVTRSAVQNAASIAGMLLTTEALVVDKPEEEEACRRPAATVTATATDPHQLQHARYGRRAPRGSRAVSAVPPREPAQLARVAKRARL